MATDVRAEVSPKNRYWISRHRYYELKHFCLQYGEWKKRYQSLDGLLTRGLGLVRPETGQASKPTEVFAEARLYFRERMEMVERSSVKAAGDLSALMLKSVTEGISYEKLRASEGVPCCREVWYAAYRRFFWVLDKERK